MGHSWTCGHCGDRDCDGCDPSDWLPEGVTLDPRDATPTPPAILDPLWVLMMRKRVARYIELGQWA